MDIILIVSLFWSVYGIAGLFGFQVIPAKYRGHDWTKDYIRRQGASWLLLGVPWLIFNRAAAYFSADFSSFIQGSILIAHAMPSVIFSVANDRKFDDMLKNVKSE